MKKHVMRRTNPAKGIPLTETIFASDGEHSCRPIDALSITGLAYLGLPTLIFLASWLRLPWALFGIGLAALATVSALQSLKIEWKPPLPIPAALIVCAVGMAWAAFGGGSHFVYANHDWIVRDAVLADLTHTDWPPSYEYRDGAHYLLRSAIGFFLPVAALGKVLGTEFLETLVFAWTAIGTCLFLLLLPLPARPGTRLFVALAILIFFSGMDVLGTLITTGEWPIFPLRIEWWTSFSYSSLTGQLMWAPNHTLPLWISTALFYRHWKHDNFVPFLCLLVPVLPLLTPFALVGLAPFFLLMLVARLRSGLGIGQIPVPALLVGIVIGGLILRILTLDIDAISMSAPIVTAANDSSRFLTSYVVFTLMEFAILGLVLLPALGHSRGLLVVALVVLATLPFGFFGPSNDMLLRVSVPSLTIMAILSMRVLTDFAPPMPIRHWLLAAILLIGAHTAFNELWRSVTWNRWQADYTRTFVETQKGGTPPHHYVGRLDKPWLNSILKEPTLVVKPPAPPLQKSAS